MPRAVTANLFTTLDGAVENPHLWQGDAFDDVLASFLGETFGNIDDVILGRRTYDMWAAHWSNPEVDDPFKDFINPVRKHVASRTLGQGDLRWQNTRLMGDDLPRYVRALKEGEGGDISVQGSLSVIAQLVRAGLMDRLHLIVHPVFAGVEDKRLFDGSTLESPVALRLLDHKVNTKGTAIMTYGPAGRA